MRKFRIGYWPLSSDLRSPGDRRRLIYWAHARGHTIVTDLSEKVDVVVASEKSDFNSKHFSRDSTPLILDLVDAYLSPLSQPDDFIRGTVKKFSGEISGKIQPFSHHIREFCLRSNAVICSSIEQENVIKHYNKNTHVILDSHDEIPFLEPRYGSFDQKSPRQILWEGQPATIHGVRQILPVLSQLSANYDISFSFVTDNKFKMILNRYIERDTLKMLERIFSGFSDKISISSWAPGNLEFSALRSTAAMIPIDLAVPMQFLKPENRLLIMWRLGMPCLTSASPAYMRVANEAGVSATCKDLDSWFDNFTLILEDPKYAHEEVLKGQNYVREKHSSKIIMDKWDAAIESVMG